MNIQTFEKLASDKSNLCLTISLNTHRTHPDNSTDPLELKNLIKEAKQRIQKSTDSDSAKRLISKLEKVTKDIDVNYNLDSLHIFISDKTFEILRSSLNVPENTISISDRFSLKPLIKLFNRTEDYLILLLSQSGVNLFTAENANITEEIKNEDFPFEQNTHYLTDTEKLSDAKKVDNQIRKFLNEVDKAVIKVYNKLSIQCVVICTESNYGKLMQVTNFSSAYLGFVNINYNDTTQRTISTDAWDLVKKSAKIKRLKVINEMKESVTNSKVLNVLSEIFRASKEGRGELLLLNSDFHQPVKMTGEFTFEPSDNLNDPDFIMDISSNIAFNVISNKGKVIFANKEELGDLENIMLKVRY